MFKRLLSLGLLALLPALPGCKWGVSACLVNCERLVTTSSGTVRGISDGYTNQFWGIPYAEAPVGPNRWQPPQHKQPWSGILDTSGFGYNGCTQWSFPHDLPRNLQTEDCLTLNVFAPDRPLDKTPDTYPVMVWIHGGAFMLGSANEQQYHAQDIANTQEVVVVTINYRLGVMGFLSLPELTAEQGHSGNYGLMDQAAAIQWVKDEIASFGGDPNNITVFGESAGGMSTCAQMASALSEANFQKAIVMSGLCDSRSWPIVSQATAENHGVNFANSMGCTNPATRLDCLRNLSHDDIKNKLVMSYNEMFLVDFAHWKFTPLFVNDGHFFTGTNLESMIAAASPKQVMIGVTKDDGSIFESFRNHESLNNYTLELNRRGYDAVALASLYPIDNYTNVGSAMAAIRTDSLFKCPAVKQSNNLVANGYTVYQYQFTEYSDSMLRVMALAQLGDNGPELGVIHSSEIAFIFGYSNTTGQLDYVPQYIVSDTMQAYWGQFAHTGNPNAAGLPTWPEYLAATREFINLGQGFTTGANLRATQCAYWNSL